MSEIKKFPNNFLWGSATASYQVEGGISNNDWAEAARHGDAPECDRACDHYNRYEEDFDIAKELNHTCHRFSIEWSRIEPEEGKFDQNEIEHYRKVLRALQQRGITPFVTCWHWTLPIWLAKKGGFSKEDFCMYFSRYCTKLIKELGDEARYWITMNEPLVVASHGYGKGTFPPYRKSPFKYFFTIDVLSQAHINAYRAMKKVRSDIRIGIAKHSIYFESNWNPINKLRKIISDWWWNDRFLEKIRTHQDFIGLNHYHYVPYGVPTRGPRTDMGWEIHPEAIYHSIMMLKDYEKPIYITENGIADAKDTLREHYIRRYLAQVHRAIQEGALVYGYMYWSLLDNFEWNFSFDKRFGLVEIDFKSQKRIIRDSARVYAEIIKNNAVEE